MQALAGLLLLATGDRQGLHQVVLGVEGASSCCAGRVGVALVQDFVAFSFSHYSIFFLARYFSSQSGLF